MACDKDYLGAINTTKYIYVYADSNYGIAAVPTLLGEASSYDAYPLTVDGTNYHDTKLGTILTDDTYKPYFGDAEWDCAEYLDVPHDCGVYDGTDMEWATAYQIADYVDDFDVSGDCASCDDSSETAWDGTFETAIGCDSGYEQWWGSLGTVSINGKTFYSSTQINYDAASPYYYLYITCWQASEWLNYDIWFGYKYMGADPAGVYDWDTGCDTRSTITIERTS